MTSIYAPHILCSNASTHFAAARGKNFALPEDDGTVSNESVGRGKRAVIAIERIDLAETCDRGVTVVDFSLTRSFSTETPSSSWRYNQESNLRKTGLKSKVERCLHGRETGAAGRATAILLLHSGGCAAHTGGNCGRMRHRRAGKRLPATRLYMQWKCQASHDVGDVQSESGN